MTNTSVQRPQSPRWRSGVLTAVWCVGIPLVIVGVILVTTMTVGMVVADPLVVTIVADGLVGLAVVLVRWRRPTWVTYRPSPPPIRHRLRLVMIIVVGMAVAFVTGQALGVWIYGLVGSPGFDATQQVSRAGPVVVMVLLTVGVAPAVEELVFRGLAYPLLRRRIPVWGAAAITVVTFGGLHGNVVQFVAVIPMAWALAVIYERTRMVWPCIGGHLVFNVAALVVPPRVIMAVATPIPLAVLLVVCVVTIALTYPSQSRSGDAETV